MPQRNDRSRSTPTTSPKNNSWFRMQAGHQSDADIYIYDEIGFWGVTAKQFISDLNALGDITHINLHINSPGGDVFEGIAIFNALKTHGASITVYVDGVAASMASVIAMVGTPVIMPENTFMMIHKPFGFTGGDAEDMRTYADLLDKVEAVLLPAYAQKTGKTTDEIAAMLADETWMSGAECLAHGFADQVTPAVKAMACIQSKRTEEFKKMPESIRNMITPPRNSAPRVQDDEPAASRTPVQAAAPVVDENSIRAQVLAEQKARVNGINDLFAMFGGRYQTLQAQCLADPECSLEQAREKLLNEMGRESTPSNKNTPAHIYAGNGNFVGDGIRQALMARAGFEKTERDNVYNGMTLREYARMSLTERGIGVSGYLGAGLYWIAASINIKPGHDYYFYIRSVNTVGKSAFVEAVGRASDDAEGYLDFFKGKITESHLGKELLEKVDLTEDNASRLDEFSKEWKDANDKWNAMWGVKIEQTKDGKHYVAGIGLSMEDTEEGKLSQFLVAANRIAFIDPANGNETPMFVAQGNQIFMNDVFLKRLTAPTITSGGNPPAFSLTPDGKLTAKNADISGNVNANSGTLNNVTINENCQIKGKLSANQIEGDIVKTVSKSFPRTNSYASGTITVRISDDQKFDRQVMIPPVLFRGGKHENFNSNNQQSYWYSTCRLRVTRNGQEIFNQSTTDAQGIFSSVIDMPAGQGTLTLTFTVSSSGANNWTPTTSISDLLVVVMKKSTAGISIS
ncbi:head maturation protease, ClpP-related [Escherichia coli]